MKKSRFTDSQIMAILKRAESGVPVTEIWNSQALKIRTISTGRAGSEADSDNISAYIDLTLKV
jgi:hypothetical protein